MSVTVASDEHQPQHSGWGRKLKFALGGLVLMAPVAIGWTFWPSEDVLEQLLRDYDFVPIKLPSRNFVPGSIVVVNESGRIRSTVCEPTKEQLDIYVKESPSTGVVQTQFSNSKFAFGADVIDRINQSLSGGAVRDVTLEFADVKVLEIIGSNLKRIQKELLDQAACMEAVEDLLNAGKYVCQSSALFEATVSYSIAYEREVAGAGKVREDVMIDVVKQVATDTKISGIEEQVDPANPSLGAQSSGNSSVRSMRFSSGENLNYGMRIHPLCLTRRDGRPIQLPSNDIEKFVVWVRQEFTVI